jgi:hypothetical protein
MILFDMLPILWSRLALRRLDWDLGTSGPFLQPTAMVLMAADMRPFTLLYTTDQHS